MQEFKARLHGLEQIYQQQFLEDENVQLRNVPEASDNTEAVWISELKEIW